MRTITTFLSAFFVTSVAMAGSTMFPVPPAADKPSHVVLVPDVAEQDYFWVQAVYPETPALAHYEALFADWVPCKPREPSWWGYGDYANGANQYLHQFTRHWITRDNRQAVTLLFQYTSSGTEYRKRPDNDQQYVAVLRHRVQDATDHFAEIKVDCPKASNPSVKRGAALTRVASYFER